MIKPVLGQAMRSVYRAVASLLSGAILDLIRAGSESQVIDGIELIRGDNSAPETAYPAVGAALQLIQAADPRRIKRIRRDIRRIYVVGSVAARYIHSRRAILLSSESVAHWDTRAVAIIIAHEAVHARLEGSGISYSRHNASRVEERCIRDTIAFACLLSDGERYVDWISRSLDHPWWTPCARRARMKADLVAALNRDKRGVSRG